MGLFDAKPKQQLKNINGYIIDELTGMLIDVPKGLKVYNIPKEVKKLDPSLNLATNKVLVSLLGASEIVFADGSIEKIPDGYFTLGSSHNLKKIVLPVGIKHLGNNCLDLTTVECNFPVTLEHLGKDMYPETQKIAIGNNIKSLGDSFASHDTNLVHVEVAGSIRELPSCFVNQCKNLKVLILHEGVEKAGNMAFRNLNGLEYVEIPDSFKMAFQTSMEDRPLSNKRGNSKYDGRNGAFEAQENNTLIIKKIHNSIPYTFQVRRGDFAEISFQGTTASIKSSNSQYISIDLLQLNPAIICQVNIKESKIQQVPIKQTLQPNQNQKPVQQPIIQPQRPVQQTTQQPMQNQRPMQQVPTQSKPLVSPIRPVNIIPQQPKPVIPPDGDPIGDGFTEEQLLIQFQTIFKQIVIPSDAFKSLNGSNQKITARKALYEAFCKRVQSTKSLDNNAAFLYVTFQNIVKKIENDLLISLVAEQQRIAAENQVYRPQYQQEVIDEELEEDHGMSM